MTPDPLYFLSEAKKRVRAKRGLYLLLKLKGVAKVCIEYASQRLPSYSVPEVNSGKIQRGAAVAVTFVLLLSFSTGRQIVPANSEEEEPPASRPIFLVGASLPPKITAKSAYLLDLRSGFVLYDKNSALKLPPASLTKIATALVALNNYELEEVVEVHPNCTFKAGESLMGLFPGEKITVRNLLRGLLIASASDAACALARHHREGSMKFVEEMNDLVATLGLERTHFVNPIGLDNTLQYSTAKELTVLAGEALHNQFFQEVVKTGELNIASADRKRWHRLETTNDLLGEVPGILGVKTGYTAKAKEVFVFYFRAERESKETAEDGQRQIKKGERELLGTVMGSDDRFGEAKSLLNWVLSSFLFP